MVGLPRGSDREAKPVEIKICGIVQSSEMTLLDSVGVDYAGLWFNVAGSPRSLDRSRFAEVARSEHRKLRCVAVTIDRDPDSICAFLRDMPVHAVQLHAFQMPAVVGNVKRTLGERTEVFKVLHIQEGRCLERPLLHQYAVSGADAFVLDSFVSRAQPGSTGIRIPRDVLDELVEALEPERVFVAGGLDARGVTELRSAWPVRGVDVDGAARRQDRIDAACVKALVRAARGSPSSQPEVCDGQR